MMIIIDLYLACTALVLMLIEDAPLQSDDAANANESEDHSPLDKTAAERVAKRA